MITAISFLSASVAQAAEVTMTFQSTISSHLKNDENSTQPDVAIFPLNQAVTFSYTYDPATAHTAVDGGIATYTVTGTFKLVIGAKEWTATTCKIRVGDYEGAATPTDLLDLEFTAAPPAGFTEASHIIRLSITGNPAPESLTTGNALPSTTNSPVLSSCSSFQVSLEPVTAPATLIPWVVHFTKPSSVAVINSP